MHPFDKHDAPKVKVAARAPRVSLMPVVLLILVSVSVLILGRTASGY